MREFEYKKVNPKLGPPKYMVRVREKGSENWEHYCRTYQEEKAEELVKALRLNESWSRMTAGIQGIGIPAQKAAASVKAFNRAHRTAAEILRPMSGNSFTGSILKNMPPSMIAHRLARQDFASMESQLLTHSDRWSSDRDVVRDIQDHIKDLKDDPGYTYKPKYILPVNYKEQFGERDGITYR